MKKIEPHLFSCKKTFKNSTIYQWFLNWLSGEYDLYLQDDSECFTVYFPYKKLSVTQLKKSDRTFVAEINVEATISEEGLQLFNSVDSLYNLLLTMHN